MSEFIYIPETITVTEDFIINKMPEANGAYVKVYLYILYLASSGKCEENSQIAKVLGLLESDVVNAYEYWIEKGLMSKIGDKYCIGNKKPDRIEKPKKDVKNIMNEDKSLSELVLIAQEILGRTLSDTDIQTLYWFYDELGFSSEVISMILEYCVSKEKRNMKYIEKVAIGWHENGITTMEDAVKYMEQRDRNYYSNLTKLFGISDRPLSKTEELYFKSWTEELKMSEEMIALAYEYCIIQTNKLSFPYMNTILINWYNKEIFTVPDAEAEHESFRAENGNKQDVKLNVYKDDYNYDEIEKKMQEKYDE